MANLQQPELIHFVSATSATGAFVLPSNGEIHDELPVRISRFNVVCEECGSLFFQFELYRVDDGTISDSEIDRIVSQDWLQIQNFAFFEYIMLREGKICLFVGTPNQLSNLLVIDRLRNFHINLHTYTYQGQYHERPGMSDEEAAAILGSPTSWIEGLEDAEIDCAICLDSIQSGEEVKALACKHVYHYACILRSTKRKQQCPLCRASYDNRQPQ